MNLKKQLGTRIQTIRKQRKLTQEHFAELVGIAQKSISRIESGNNYPTPETLCAIANALSVEIYELFIFNRELSYKDMKQEIIDALNDNNNIAYLYEALKTPLH
ncbi:MAG: helix-turn-helix domain-containing protein [bacterium]|nr:helix-turn-helix domain-containing protein [bacterium]